MVLSSRAGSRFPHAGTCHDLLSVSLTVIEEDSRLLVSSVTEMPTELVKHGSDLQA